MRCVYFIKPIGLPGPFKVGCSLSPIGRRDALQSWSPLPLEVVAEIEGDFLLERRFHQLFIASHRGFEWFDETPELLAVVEQIKAGAFDVGTLPAAGKRTAFRRKRDLSYLTEGWRYRNSFSARFRNIRRHDWKYCRARFREIVGVDDPYYVSDETMLALKPRLEALLVELKDNAPVKVAA